MLGENQMLFISPFGSSIGSRGCRSHVRPPSWVRKTLSSSQIQPMFLSKKWTFCKPGLSVFVRGGILVSSQVRPESEDRHTICPLNGASHFLGLRTAICCLPHRRAG